MGAEESGNEVAQAYAGRRGGVRMERRNPERAPLAFPVRLPIGEIGRFAEHHIKRRQCAQSTLCLSWEDLE